MHDVVDIGKLDADQDRAWNRRFGFHDAGAGSGALPVLATWPFPCPRRLGGTSESRGDRRPLCLAHV